MRPEPFAPLLRVLERYRADVHELRPPTPEAAIAEVERSLGTPMPPALRDFLRRWNGAVLFRGALRIRAAAELAPAAAEHPQVVVFADGPREHDRWAYAPEPGGAPVVGRWRPAEDGGPRFEPMHEDFDRWLAGQIRVLDEGRVRPEAVLAARLEADPDSPWLLLEQAEALLERGEAATATELLRRATAARPSLRRAWERLGDALRDADPGAAREAWLRALRSVRLPAAYPSADAPTPELLARLSRTFPAGAPEWERELVRLLEEGVTDVASAEELAFVEAAALELAGVRLARADRSGARAALVELLERARDFRVRAPLSEALLALADLEIDLGHHDEAERHLSRLRDAPAPLPARAQLRLGRIAVLRQEPWAEEILEETLDELPPERAADRCRALLLLAERHLLQDRLDAVEEPLERAAALAREAGGPALVAAAALLRGDLARGRGLLDEAAEWYARARAEAGEERELLQRVLVRRGDLFLAAGQRERAAADYARAAAAYRELELPLREAWTLLKLGALGDRGAAERARDLFREADLAAGVASADAVLGEPAANLDWHVERAAEHARERANAWRGRPPLTRADAERPERRLGAHRVAVARCDVRVVHVLADELDRCARALGRGSAPRPTDPRLVRYVAAADLLAGHRSWEAAEALLRQLVEVVPEGAAWRGLVGALSRSPNAALVDGLLELLTAEGPPQGRAAAAEVLGWRRELAAVEPLLEVVARPTSPVVRRAAVVALGRIGDPQAVDPLLDLLDEPRLDEAVSVALLLLGDWRGLDHQAQLLASARAGTNRSAGEIVGRYGGPSYLLLLMRTSEMEGPAGLGAIEGLGFLGDPRGIPRLVDILGERDLDRRRMAAVALELVTGHAEDPGEPLLRHRWAEWWEANGQRFQPGVRFRSGHPMHPGHLVDRLGHDDAAVRRATYDELVIATGERLPFDAEGPYRVQRAHQHAWRRWWRSAADRFPPGQWSFHGQPVG